ncbi:MAG: phosphatidate cytidylyltransferase [Verrucomicrobia bacterium]|nr:phosphatidate cytidylyltransferase [Verrucomicrobiota bacterium]MCF7708905.1 phosphatidate cytidylyltransferase [Verrucomicrobiota bacterium]
MPSDSNQKDGAKPKSAVFLRRLVVSVVLWALVVGGLFSGNALLSDSVFFIIMVLLTGAGLWEFYDLVRRRGLVCFKALGIAGGILLISGTFLYLHQKSDGIPQPALANDFECSFLIVFVLGLCVRQFLSRSNPDGLLAISTTLFGLMYVAWLLNFIQKINFFPEVEGVYYVFYFILVTKLSDSGAQVIGTLFGRHKMIPRVSPSKTWEGFGGAMLFGTVSSVVFAWLVDGRLAGMNLTHSIILGILLSAAAVLGDLIESLFKREAGVKDSGRLFPEIGGILDLLDSLLFNAPLMYLYLRYILTG